MPPSSVRQGLKACCFALVVVSSALAAGTATAQDVAPADRQAFLSTVSSTTTTSVVGGVIITVTVSSGTANLSRYLRHNAVALRHDVTRGAGPTVDDLAHAFGVSDRRAFGNLLRKRRRLVLDVIANLSEVAVDGFAKALIEDIKRAAL